MNKEAHREAQKRYYQKNKAYHLLANRIKRQRMLEYIRELKRKPCADCHQSFPYFVMDFDHRDPALKSFNISGIVRHLSWQKIKTEVAKCDVVCANCHRYRTFQ